jgi:RimJ/RimL family protein N-acetyltransferase
VDHGRPDQGHGFIPPLEDTVLIEPDLQPTLIGEHTLIRPIAASDWNELFAAASDPLIWAGHPAKDRYKEEVFRGYFEGALTSGSAFVFLDRMSSRIIGSSRYHGYDPGLSEMEIGWTFLVRESWGGRVNAEIKALMIGHAFRFVETVIFWIGVSNIRSQTAIERIGARRREGVVARPPLNDIYEIRRPQTT